MAFIAEAGRRIEIEAASNLMPERLWLEFKLGGMNTVQVAVLKADFLEAVGRWLAQDTPAAREARITHRVVSLEAARKDISHA